MKDERLNNIGKLLKTIREGKGNSSFFMKEKGVTPATLKKIETGGNYTVAKLLQYLDANKLAFIILDKEDDCKAILDGDRIFDDMQIFGKEIKTKSINDFVRKSRAAKIEKLKKALGNIDIDDDMINELKNLKK